MFTTKLTVPVLLLFTTVANPINCNGIADVIKFFQWAPVTADPQYYPTCSSFQLT